MQDDFKKAYGYSLKLLAHKDYFTGEILKLLCKQYPEEISVEVLDHLVTTGYIDDQRLFERYVAGKSEAGYGAYYIREKLRLKGYETGIESIRHVIITQEIDLEEIVRKLAVKYVNRKGKYEPNKLYNSCIAYLGGRGFELGLAHKIVKEVIGNESYFFS